MNLYVHFPFCRRKCAYCALYSRVGVSRLDRDAYVVSLAEEMERGGLRVSGRIGAGLPPEADCRQSTDDFFSTVYFGGGSPALCDLRPLFSVLNRHLISPPSYEFTVELHPLDVTEELLEMLKAGGVNRISMGVQSFDDATLAAMGRGVTVEDSLRAFALVKRYFDNAGIDLIVGFPGDHGLPESGPWLRRFADLGMRHCSVYSLQNERGLKDVPDDDVVMNRIREVSAALGELGLARYEISNYAVPGFECRHNLAVWTGEDYIGLGEGACGRIGLKRTRGVRSGYETEMLSETEDLKERTIFRLRTREGLDVSRFPEWREALDRLVEEGLLVKTSVNQIGGEVGIRALPPDDMYCMPGGQRSDVYFLTERGTEVCDTILAEIV